MERLEEGYIIHTDMELTYGEGSELFIEKFDRYHEADSPTELGLPLAVKDTIFTKYGVNCDPDKSSFHKSLFDQFENKGYLSPKQVNALRK